MTVTFHPIILESILFDPEDKKQQQSTRSCSPRGRKHTTNSDSVWPCPVDLFEREGSLVLRADLPGFKKEEITTNVDADGSLNIVAERKRPEADQQKTQEADKQANNTQTWILNERSVRDRVGRTVSLPRDVQIESAQASFVDGVLEIVLPKAKPPTRQITIL